MLPISNPNQPLVLTDDPGACEAEHKAQGFRLLTLYVLRFHPAMQPDLIDRKCYAMKFYRPAQDPQGQLITCQ